MPVHQMATTVVLYTVLHAVHTHTAACDAAAALLSCHHGTPHRFPGLSVTAVGARRALLLGSEVRARVVMTCTIIILVMQQHHSSSSGGGSNSSSTITNATTPSSSSSSSSSSQFCVLLLTHIALLLLLQAAGLGEEDVGLIGVTLPSGEFIELVPWNADLEWDVDTWGRW
jgi:hypothetical protein